MNDVPDNSSQKGEQFPKNKVGRDSYLCEGIVDYIEQKTLRGYINIFHNAGFLLDYFEQVELIDIVLYLFFSLLES